MPLNPQIGTIQIFAKSGTDTAPDSVTIAGNFLFVAYANGVASDGSDGGTSEIVQYDLSGNIVHNYDIKGSVDGLKFDPFTEKLWALQNQDGNSTLTIIDPVTHRVSQPIAPDVASATRGFDDVVFQDGKVFLSYTNPSDPVNPQEAVIVKLEGGNHPGGELETTPILKAGATGTNTVTHATHEAVPLTDPDSLKAAPNGDLLLSSGADGTIVDVHHAGKADQSVSFTEVIDVNDNRLTGLDDVIKTDASSGTFFLTSSGGNSVESFHVTGLNPNDYYASIGSLGFGSVDPATGKFHLLVPDVGAHGIAFTPDNAEHVGPVETFEVPTGDTPANSAPDSVTIAGDYLFVAYANGVASDGSDGRTSEIVQYGLSGHIVHTYDIKGSVDGLKFDPFTEKLWALQNQDGNSTLTIIDPVTHHVSQPIAPDVASATRGFDDVIFQDGKVFLSYTNPSAPTDAVIVSLEGGNHPGSELETNPILTAGATGTNTVTQQTNKLVPLADPDSLKAAPNGDLLLSSGADGTIVDVHHAGKADQSVSFTEVTDASGNHLSGLDDVIKTDASSGTFYLTSTSGNSVESFHVTGLNPNDYYASISSLGFGSVDPTTGVFHLLVQDVGAHGIAFTSDESAMADHSHPNGDDAANAAAMHQLGGHWFV